MIDLVQNTLDGVMVGVVLRAAGAGLHPDLRHHAPAQPRLRADHHGRRLSRHLCLPAARCSAPCRCALLVIAGAALAGLYVERLCFRPFGERAAIASMVSSFAVWMQIEEAATLALPRHLNPFPPLVAAAPIELGPLPVPARALLMLAVACAAAALVYWALHRTRFGLGVRTVIDHRRAAELVGVPVERVLMLAFVLASAIGGVGGLPDRGERGADHADVRHVGDHQGPDRHDAGRAGLGAGRHCWAGSLLGVVEAHAQWLFGPQVRDLSPGACCSRVLALWPGGLMGAQRSRRCRGAVQRRGYERHGRFPVGVLSNIGIISFVALSAYVLLLAGEVSFGQQAFFAIGAYAAGIAHRHAALAAGAGACARRARRRARRRRGRPRRRCASAASTSPWRRWPSPRWCASPSSSSPGRSTIGGDAGRPQRHRRLRRHPLPVRERDHATPVHGLPSMCCSASCSRLSSWPRALALRAACCGRPATDRCWPSCRASTWCACAWLAAAAAGALAGLGGGLYAHLLTYVEPATSTSCWACTAWPTA